MHREDEYKHLANSTRKRGGEEQNALLRAQWEILAGHLRATCRSIEEDR